MIKTALVPLVFCLSVTATPIWAQDDEVGAIGSLPPPMMFSGQYEVVGRDSDHNLINLLLRIEPAKAPSKSQPWAVQTQTCQSEGSEAIFTLTPDSFGEQDNIVEGTWDDEQIWCLVFNNGGNYPLLNCQSIDGAKFGIYPAVDEFSDPC